MFPFSLMHTNTHGTTMQLAITIADNILQAHESSKFKALSPSAYDEELSTLAGALIALAHEYLETGSIEHALTVGQELEMSGVGSINIDDYEPYSWCRLIDRAIITVATASIVDYYNQTYLPGQGFNGCTAQK